MDVGEIVRSVLSSFVGERSSFAHEELTPEMTTTIRDLIHSYFREYSHHARVYSIRFDEGGEFEIGKFEVEVVYLGSQSRIRLVYTLQPTAR